MTELVASQVNLGNNVLLFFDLPLTAEEVEHIRKSKNIMDRELWELEKIASGMLNDHPSSINVEDYSASPKTIRNWILLLSISASKWPARRTSSSSPTSNQVTCSLALIP